MMADKTKYRYIGNVKLEFSTEHALKKANITDQNQVMRLPSKTIAALSGLREETVNGVKDMITAQSTPDMCTVFDLISKESDRSIQQWKLSSLCPVINQALRGGLPSGVVSEITGESASGKTQLCLGFCLSVQTLAQHCGGAVYICTEDAFPSKRLHDMIQHNNHTSKSNSSFGDNIFIEHVADFETLEFCVQNKLPVLLSHRGVKLVVIDSVTALFRCQYERAQSMERAKHLNRFSISLQKLAAKHNIPIVCVNQVSGAVSQGGSGNIPALGLAWANQIACRLMLSRPSPNLEHALKGTDNQQVSALWTYRIFSMVFSPHAPQTEMPVYIDDSGMHGMEL